MKGVIFVPIQLNTFYLGGTESSLNITYNAHIEVMDHDVKRFFFSMIW